MDINSKMMEVAKAMLLEAKFNDIFKSIQTGFNNVGDTITVYDTSNEKHTFKIINFKGNDVLLQNDKGKFVIDKSSLDKNKFTLYGYDEEKNVKDNSRDTIEVKKMVIVNTASGKPQNIDIDYDEYDAKQEVDLDNVESFNDIISNSDKNDIFIITSETNNEDESDTIVNDLYFKITGIKENWYRLKLVDIQSGAEGEVSPEVKFISNQLSDNDIFIGGKNGFFKEINNIITIDLIIGKTNGKVVPINGVIDVQNNNIETDINYDDEEKKFSKEELQAYLKGHPTFQSMLMKKPSLLDTITGASPKGLMQLKNMVQKYDTKNSYLTKGKNVKFKVMSPSIKSGDFRHKLLNRKDTYYEAKVTGDKTLKLGTIGRGHWEIVLNKEIEDNTYNAEVNFCKVDRTCNTITKDSVIKILTNG